MRMGLLAVIVPLVLLATLIFLTLDRGVSEPPLEERLNSAPIIEVGPTSEPGSPLSGAQVLSPVRTPEEERREQVQHIEELLETRERVKVVMQVSPDTDKEEFISRYGLDAESAKRFELFPVVAVEIDRDDLESLRDSVEMEALQEDMLFAPTLLQSVPIIGADDVVTLDGYNGSGVVVVVLDTGVNSSHPAFQDRVVDEACYSTHSPAANVYSLCPGDVEAVNGSGTGLDCDLSVSGCGHGTHVAGIVAANSTLGNGVAPGAQIVSIKVFSEFTTADNCGSSSTPCARAYFSDVLLGLQRSYELRSEYTIGAVSMSLGGGQYTANCDASFASLKTAIDDLRSAGIPTVISSGNDGYTNAMGSPACVSSAVSVGATTKADAVAAYSNSASFLTLLAPGSSISAPVITGGYGLKSGTSMATPHVSGAFALLRQAYPARSVDELLAAFEGTGTNLTKSGVTKPRINVDLALESLFEVVYSNFDGDTTDFQVVPDLGSVCSPVLENSSSGKITFDGCVNATGADLDQHVRIERNRVSVNSSALASWNRSANLTLYGLGLVEPVIVADDTKTECAHCRLVSNVGGDIVFSVEHFSSYTVIENVSLNISDDTDTVQRTTGQEVQFSANLSYVNGTPIPDSSCAADFETVSGVEGAAMAYNATSLRYEHTRSFTAGGEYDWNVTCTHATNPTIATTDQYTILEYGTLREEFESHLYAPVHSVNQNVTFTSGAALYCDGNGTATCGDITAYHLDNRTGSLSETDGNPLTVPVYTVSPQGQSCLGLQTGAPCYVNWTLNASGPTGSRVSIAINYSSTLPQVSSLTSALKPMEIDSADHSEVTAPNASVTVGETGQYAGTQGNSIGSGGGNITEVALVSRRSTRKWQGFYGNVSDALLLGDGINVLFSFGGLEAYAVIATQAVSFDWASVTAASPTEVDTHWNFATASDVDQAVDTFQRYKFFGDIEDVPYVTLNERFYSGIVQDGTPVSKNDLGFIATVNTSGATGFREGVYNYELLVPVESATETYYLYLALE